MKEFKEVIKELAKEILEKEIQAGRLFTDEELMPIAREIAKKIKENQNIT